MQTQTLGALVIVLGLAVLAPVVSDRLAGRVLVPSVVLEVLFGILVGPALLDLVRVDDVISALSDLGLAMLFFLAGYEVDADRVRGAPLRSAVTGWGLSVVIAVGGALTVGLATGSALLGAFIAGLALTTTSLGTVLPIVRDSGLLPTPYGAHVLAVGAVGEFGPIVAVALLLSGRRPAAAAVVLAGFLGIVAVTAWLAARPRSRRLQRLLSATLGTSAQLAVRLALLVVVLLVWVASASGLDFLLGAFASGLVVRLAIATAEPQNARVVESKLEAVGFGFLVPIFFVVSGVRFDLNSLLQSPALFMLLPAFLAAMLVVRSVPTLLRLPRTMAPAERRSLALLAATALPLILAITTIGVDEHVLSPGLAAALVGAGMLSVLVLPASALRLVARRPTSADASAAP